MDKELIEQKILESYRKIDFTNKFKNISLNNCALESTMSRMNKSENLKILKSFGYSFKISSPGQLYLFTEEFDFIKLEFISQISKGLIVPYIYIYIHNEKVKILDWFAGVYRILVDDENAYITAPKFSTYEELWHIMSELLKIYEDFKEEFLKNMKDVEL